VTVRQNLVYRISFFFIALIAMCWSITSHAIIVNMISFRLPATAAHSSAMVSVMACHRRVLPISLQAPPRAMRSWHDSQQCRIWGLLQLNSANGALSANATEAPRLTLAATLLTSTTGGATQLGTGNTLVETGLFSLTIPPGPLFSAYGIQFTDAAGAGANQLVQLFVRFNEATGQPQIAYILQDFVANTITTLGTSPLNLSLGADQILFTLSRPNVGDNNFFGSFSYLSGGSIVGGGSFATPGVLFQGENFVRGRFFVAEAIPEPETYAMLLAGLGLLGFVARRRKQQSA
jgi:hypothetical protein